ncbi:hypothetical protein F5Y18DRAFT_421633 [Xylariaceae sp. FL1019]|nr:hypothetical protein F5Y18DRAFT_421633 [Xylariaceae sp. FL1019]
MAVKAVLATQGKDLEKFSPVSKLLPQQKQSEAQGERLYFGLEQPKARPRPIPSESLQTSSKSTSRTKTLTLKPVSSSAAAILPSIADAALKYLQDHFRRSDPKKAATLAERSLAFRTEIKAEEQDHYNPTGPPSKPDPDQYGSCFAEPMSSNPKKLYMADVHGAGYLSRHKMMGLDSDGTSTSLGKTLAGIPPWDSAQPNRSKTDRQD